MLNNKKINILEDRLAETQSIFQQLKNLIDPNNDRVKTKAILDYNIVIHNPKTIAISRKMYQIHSFYMIVDFPATSDFLGVFDKYYSTTVIVDDSLQDFEVKIIN